MSSGSAQRSNRVSARWKPRPTAARCSTCSRSRRGIFPSPRSPTGSFFYPRSGSEEETPHSPVEGLIEGIVEPEEALRSELIDGSALEKQLLQAARPNETAASTPAGQVVAERKTPLSAPVSAPISAPVSAPISAPISAPVSASASETLEGFSRGVSESGPRREYRCRPRGYE